MSSQFTREPDGDSVGRRTILIVEDHRAVAQALHTLLMAAFPACPVLVAGNAESALERCAVEVPALVIMDISLPGMNGIEATRRIKALSPATRVVMHTSNDMQVFRDEAATAGAAAFVSKRHTFTDLVPAVAALLPGAG